MTPPAGCVPAGAAALRDFPSTENEAMTTLTQASRQWMSRPHDERFLSLYEMADRMRSLRERSHNEILSIRRVEVQPDSDHRGLVVNGVEPTHHAFSQLCTLASPGASPAGYFRDSGVPAEVIADCLNWNLRLGGKTEAAFLATEPAPAKAGELRAVTAPTTVASGTPISSTC